MNFRRGKQDEGLEMNLIPMIDVLLVIIIFLVVSATFSRINELQITLPTAEANAPQDKATSITVNIDAAGRYTIDDQELMAPSVESIMLALRKSAGDNKEPTIVINADANSTHQSVVNVMEASRQAGYTRITFATQVQTSP